MNEARLGRNGYFQTSTKELRSELNIQCSQNEGKLNLTDAFMTVHVL